MIPSNERLKLTNITDGRTLNGMEKAGHIKRCPGFAYVDSDIKRFTYKGDLYIVDFVDGCFFPFVFRGETKRPGLT
jgi:hypothetical protein